jgi:phosphohistidine phosphatase
MVFLPDISSCSKLYFLRHGLAGQHGDPKYKDDSLRPLTAEGQEKMRSGAQGMQTLGLKFDTIISSPYLRAKQTAEIVAEAYKLKKKDINLTNNLLPPASIEELMREVHTRFPISRNVLLVGHEPHLTGMISSLLKSDEPLSIDFKKGGLCCLSVNGPPEEPNAILDWLLTSTQLGLMSKEKQ